MRKNTTPRVITVAAVAIITASATYIAFLRRRAALERRTLAEAVQTWESEGGAVLSTDDKSVRATA